MDPVVLVVAGGGVLLIVWLVSVLWGWQMEPLADEAELLGELRRKEPEAEIAEITMAADKLAALAYDPKHQEVYLCHAHGLFHVWRKLQPPEFERVSWEEALDGYLRVTLHFQAFERKEISLRFSQAQKTEARMWIERLSSLSGKAGYPELSTSSLPPISKVQP